MNLAAAYRDGIVGTPAANPTRGKFAYTAIPLLTGREEDLQPDRTTYVQEDGEERVLPYVGNVPMVKLLGAEVRLLRVAGLKSAYAPIAGVRYDGM